jgi:hypothetical protein
MNKLFALTRSIEILPILSTLSYFLPIFTIKNRTVWPFVVLILIFSSLHHFFPENQFFRILDWTTAFILIVLIMNKISDIGPVVWLCLFAGLNIWLASIFSFYYLDNKFLYEILHSSWHVLSAFILYQTF